MKYEIVQLSLGHKVIPGRFSQCYEKRLLASSCLSVRMEQLGSHWKDFHETWCWRIVQKFKYETLATIQDKQVAKLWSNGNLYYQRNFPIP
jgi:hypothetical protein